MKKYEEAEEVFAGRNSYSKTDHDATFMQLSHIFLTDGRTFIVKSSSTVD